MGQYGPKEHNEKRTFPISAIISGVSTIVNLVSAILVYIQRRKLENSDHMSAIGLHFPNRIPKSLESLLLNFVLVGWIFVHGVCSFAFKWAYKSPTSN